MAISIPTLFEHASPVTDDLILCYSDSADYEYYVRLENARDMEKALEIANQELYLWGNQDELEDPEQQNYYFYAGYGEVVQTALFNAGIIADFFYKDEE